MSSYHMLCDTPQHVTPEGGNGMLRAGLQHVASVYALSSPVCLFAGKVLAEIELDCRLTSIAGYLQTVFCDSPHDLHVY